MAGSLYLQPTSGLEKSTHVYRFNGLAARLQKEQAKDDIY
jgi:hypothetical protein